MAQDKEKLKKLLKFIEELAVQDGNEWFKVELIRKFTPEQPKSDIISDAPINLINDNVSAIHKYLTLDVIPVIDYTLIVDKVVQNQLYRDCLEMGKYRLGKINGQVDFEEFSKYAHMQAEELVNYFYIKKYNNIIAIRDAIILYNKTAKVWDKSYVTEIPYSTKLKSLSIQFNLNGETKNCLEQIKNLRNYLSHRSSLTSASEDEILASAKKLPQRLDFLDLSEENKKNIKVYNDAKTIVFKRNAEWNVVYRSLNKLKDVVLSNI